MAGQVDTDLVARGEELLRDCDFAGAREAFEAAIAERETPEALDGLGRAHWWTRDVEAALAYRERSYTAFKRSGSGARAARIALWLSREYSEALGNEPISRGWMARAEGLLHDEPPSAAHGWLALTRGRLALNPADAFPDATEALRAARTFDDPDLEATALALLGLARIARGEVQAGIASLDEAMVAATSGEVADPIVFGNICCLATRGVEEAGDAPRLMRWNEVIMSFLERTGHVDLLTFCGTCCAEVLTAAGELDEAEGWLVRTIRELEESGQRTRCVHPAAKLAELRLLQGRFEEAERLLAGLEDRPDALRATASLHLARNEGSIAAALLHRRLNQVGDGLLTAPVLALLVDAQLVQGHDGMASETAERLADLADRTAQPRLRASAAFARGRVAAAIGDVSARSLLEDATSSYDLLGMPLEAARARLELARVLRDVEPELALREARVAAEAFERLALSHLGDRAEALVRGLGGPARTGPKGLGLLSKREIEVLHLLGEGLTNAEIAARLYISTKTAGNHVSNILAKLHLRSRQEAAAYAIRNLDGATSLPNQRQGQR